MIDLANLVTSLGFVKTFLETNFVYVVVVCIIGIGCIIERQIPGSGVGFLVSIGITSCLMVYLLRFGIVGVIVGGIIFLLLWVVLEEIFYRFIVKYGRVKRE